VMRRQARDLLTTRGALIFLFASGFGCVIDRFSLLASSLFLNTSRSFWLTQDMGFLPEGFRAMRMTYLARDLRLSCIAAVILLCCSWAIGLLIGYLARRDKSPKVLVPPGVLGYAIFVLVTFDGVQQGYRRPELQFERSLIVMLVLFAAVFPPMLRGFRDGAKLQQFSNGSAVLVWTFAFLTTGSVLLFGTWPRLSDLAAAVCILNPVIYWIMLRNRPRVSAV
jgi:hypothetical protein